MTSVDDIRDVLAAKAEALVTRDAAALAALIIDDFVYVNASAQIFDKVAYISTFCTSGDVVFLHQRPTNIVVKPMAGVVVATLDIEDHLRIDGREAVGRYRSLCVFVRSPARWRWAAGQTTAAPTR